VLATAVSWAVAGLCRRRITALMGSAPPPKDRDRIRAVGAFGEGKRPQVRFDHVENRRAALRLVVTLSGMSLLIGLTQAWLALAWVYEDRGFSLRQTLIVGAVYAWPMVLAWGMVWRWAYKRVLAGAALYMLAMIPVVMLASSSQQSLAAVGIWLAAQVAVPMSMVFLIGGSARIRAVMPYLLPPFLLLSAASNMGLEILARNVDSPGTLQTALLGSVGAYGTLLLFAFLPWILMAWPVFALGRRLAGAYRAKRFSDLIYSFSACWLVVLCTNVLTGVDAAGPGAFAQALAWLWIPLSSRALEPWLVSQGSPPTLLVLRVFQRDKQVEELFDRVIERWRHSGNTLLIAGSDLISRTLTPDALFAYLSGRLAHRFVGDERELAEYLGDLDLLPDWDGRYRVNECFCFDSSWQACLDAMVQRSDVALMDLRGFAQVNSGCMYELAALAHATHLRRVVLLHDEHTDRALAQNTLGSASSERFYWQRAEGMDQALAMSVLAALFMREEPAGPRVTVPVSAPLSSDGSLHP